jgi:IclR family transcriptional regulator, acetate operon repressor
LIVPPRESATQSASRSPAVIVQTRDNHRVATGNPAVKKTGTQAIERAISILRLFADNETPLSLTEIARAVGLTPTTAHRILATLVRERLLANDAALSERYQIGPDSLLLFAAAARRFGVAAARSELEALVEATHETAAIGVLDGRDTIIVLQVESDLPLRFSRDLGTRVPTHVSAMGKAILAFSTDDRSTGVATLGKLHRFTDRTITDRPKLLAELEETRQRGWAVNDNERYDGVRGIAVPISRPDEPVRAALGVQGPAERLSDARIDEVVEALRTSARRLSLHLQLTSF